MQYSAKNKMGLFSCVAMIIGACIGSAIFSISGVTVFYAGGSAVVSWLAAALIYGAYGLILAELAVRYPLSGGIYIFPKRAIGGRIGTFWGFVSGWGYIVSNVIAIGFSAIYAGIYFVSGFPELCLLPHSDLIVSMLSLAFSLVLIFRSGRKSMFIQNALVVLLVITMLLYCVLAFAGGHIDPANFRAFFTSGDKGAGGFASAIPLAMVAYGGCVAVSFMTSEVNKPSRNVPGSLFIGLGLVALIYASVVATIVGTLPMDVIRDDAGLRFIPLFASISHGSLSAYPWLARLVSLSGVIALLTTITVLLRINARAMQAMAEEGFFHDAYTGENSHGAAPLALMTMAVIALAMCFVPQWATHMITLGAVLNIASMSITCVSLIFARRKKPGAPFMAPLGLFLPVSVIMVFLACYLPDVLGGGSSMWLFTGIVYLAGVLVYFAGRKRSVNRIGGIVVRGKGRGHLHAMPTANLSPYDGVTLPRFGVWETKVFLDGKTYVGLTNVGLRPSDDDSPIPTVETLILDFSGEIYERPMTLEFRRFVRETMTFPSLDELRKQIDKDIESIRHGNLS